MENSIIADNQTKGIAQHWYLFAYQVKGKQGEIKRFFTGKTSQLHCITKERFKIFAEEIKSKCEPMVDTSSEIEIISISYLGSCDYEQFTKE